MLCNKQFRLSGLSICTMLYYPGFDMGAYKAVQQSCGDIVDCDKCAEDMTLGRLTHSQMMYTVIIIQLSILIVLFHIVIYILNMCHIQYNYLFAFKYKPCLYDGLYSLT